MIKKKATLSSTMTRKKSRADPKPNSLQTQTHFRLSIVSAGIFGGVKQAEKPSVFAC